MKKLVSLTVLAFFVAVPQCFGQDAEQSQPLEQQQLVQMFHLVMVQQRPDDDDIKICHIIAPAEDPFTGFTLRLPKDSPAIAGHCEHGDCTEGNFENIGSPNKCECDDPVVCIP